MEVDMSIIVAFKKIDTSIIFILSISFMVIIFFYDSAFCENYYETGKKYGQTIGTELGKKEVERCLVECKEPRHIKDVWDQDLQNSMMLLMSKEIDQYVDQKDVLQHIEEQTKMMQDDSFGLGIADGFSETYYAITKDALYKSISSKQRWSRKLSDWEQGYIDGYNNGRPKGVHDKINGNPFNWRSRYIEHIFRSNESSDAQYINGYMDGFKSGYQSGY
jgi:hypothetical protein